MAVAAVSTTTPAHFAATGSHFGIWIGRFGFGEGGGGATRTFGTARTGSDSDPKASRPSADDGAVAVEAKAGAADDMRPTCSAGHKRGILRMVTVRLLLTRRRVAPCPRRAAGSVAGAGIKRLRAHAAPPRHHAR